MSGKTGLRAGAWTAAVLLALASPGAYPSQGGPPNLRPYQPEGWSDLIVVSTRQGDNLNARRLTATDRLYVDFAVINAGGSPVTAPFRIDLYLGRSAAGHIRCACAARPPGLPVPRGLPDPEAGPRHPYPADRGRRRRHGGRKRRIRQRVHPDLDRRRGTARP